MPGRQLKSVVLGIVTALLAVGSAAEELAIEEIIVTATKRAESVQDVPVAINVVDAGTIEAMGIDEYTDLTKISPSLTMNRGDWATNSGFSLRGIGTNVFSTNIDPSVSIIVDDVAWFARHRHFLIFQIFITSKCSVDRKVHCLGKAPLLV